MKDSQTLPTRAPVSLLRRSPTNPPQRILVADDDSYIRELSTKVLIRSGYEVDAAADGAAAWQALTTDSYDLLITDQNMPKVSGVELLKKLRAARLALPVILMSGMMPMEELNRNPSLQLAALLPKPFCPDDLLGTVKEVLRTTGGACAPIALPPNWESQPSASAWQSPFIATHRFQSRPPE